jgi:hypothetical protein
MHGKQQELETLINEEALLIARYLRNERDSWIPRIVGLMEPDLNFLFSFPLRSQEEFSSLFMEF